MKTCLYEKHTQLGAKLVDYYGWQMPLNYTKGMIHEHLCVRKALGVFDLSHMGCLRIEGKDAEQLLDYLSVNRIAGRQDSSIAYTIFTSPTGGCVDDLLLLREDAQRFLAIVNPANTDKDLRHLLEYSGGLDVQIHQVKDLGILSLQGPHSPMVLALFFPESARLPKRSS
jgi:aminomethyltransferase